MTATTTSHDPVPPLLSAASQPSEIPRPRPVLPSTPSVESQAPAAVSAAVAVVAPSIPIVAEKERRLLAETLFKLACAAQRRLTIESGRGDAPFNSAAVELDGCLVGSEPDFEMARKVARKFPCGLEPADCVVGLDVPVTDDGFQFPDTLSFEVWDAQIELFDHDTAARVIDDRKLRLLIQNLAVAVVKLVLLLEKPGRRRRDFDNVVDRFRLRIGKASLAVQTEEKKRHLRTVKVRQREEKELRKIEAQQQKAMIVAKAQQEKARSVDEKERRKAEAQAERDQKKRQKNQLKIAVSTKKEKGQKALHKQADFMASFVKVSAPNSSRRNPSQPPDCIDLSHDKPLPAVDVIAAINTLHYADRGDAQKTLADSLNQAAEDRQQKLLAVDGQGSRFWPAKGQRNGKRVVLYSFHDNHRPHFFGLSDKKSSRINGRRPFDKDSQLDYEFDSDDEWEEEEPGESLADSDEEKSDAGSDSPQDDDNDFIDENDQGSGEDEPSDIQGRRKKRLSISTEPVVLADFSGGRLASQSSSILKQFTAVRNPLQNPALFIVTPVPENVPVVQGASDQSVPIHPKPNSEGSVTDTKCRAVPGRIEPHSSSAQTVPATNTIPSSNTANAVQHNQAEAPGVNVASPNTRAASMSEGSHASATLTPNVDALAEKSQTADKTKQKHRIMVKPPEKSAPEPQLPDGEQPTKVTATKRKRLTATKLSKTISPDSTLTHLVRSPKTAEPKRRRQILVSSSGPDAATQRMEQLPEIDTLKQKTSFSLPTTRAMANQQNAVASDYIAGDIRAEEVPLSTKIASPSANASSVRADNDSFPPNSKEPSPTSVRGPQFGEECGTMKRPLSEMRACDASSVEATVKSKKSKAPMIATRKKRSYGSVESMFQASLGKEDFEEDTMAVVEVRDHRPDYVNDLCKALSAGSFRSISQSTWHSLLPITNPDLVMHLDKKTMSLLLQSATGPGEPNYRKKMAKVAGNVLSRLYGMSRKGELDRVLGDVGTICNSLEVRRGLVCLLQPVNESNHALSMYLVRLSIPLVIFGNEGKTKDTKRDNAASDMKFAERAMKLITDSTDERAQGFAAALLQAVVDSSSELTSSELELVSHWTKSKLEEMKAAHAATKYLMKVQDILETRPS